MLSLSLTTLLNQPLLHTLHCSSRDDEQLLLTIPFTQEVKIFAIDMVSQEDEEAAPSTVRLYVNQDGMTFSDVDDVEPVQILELSASDLSPDAPTKLKFTKFQQVSTITIFIEDNNGADYSVLSSLRLFGAPTSKCDMSAGLQKC